MAETPATPSLADRITKDEPIKSWADEVDSPSAESAPRVDNSQLDGAGGPLNGSELREPDYAVEIKLSDMQADPNNPLFSVKSFEELNLKPEVLKGVIAMNFRRPSKVQERTLPLLMMEPRHNMIGQSQSGTGKTAAFVLNVLQRIDISTPQLQSTPQALILAPSRELARQIASVVSIMGTFMEGLKVEAAIPTGPAERGRRIEAAVVVGTPGTVQDMIRRKAMDMRGLQVLVLDEADNMLDQGGMGDQCIRVKRSYYSQQHFQTTLSNMHNNSRQMQIR
ncbi:hypothetical protein BT93_L1210 [Corymbia citriodora subsp. variegata]|uniref:RNA helicase n=1 Tax=Corymbia citriodora subsp. variegata TaxID=360336 RepID=A0A8T0CEH6_CORYI|nr:hypothetical protein BT93_L1210 [Corymbia citriodora subsp. variegata]